jgi:heat shock protein 4
VDLGSTKAVMAVVKKGGIDIVLNDSTNRSTPVQVAFTREERIVGDPVKFQIRKNMKNTIVFPSRFLGLNQECAEQIKLEKRFITHDITYLDNKKLAFKIKSMDEEYQLTIEQVLAFYFTKIRKYYEKSEIACKEIVLSIPSYCSNVERQSLLDAA